MNTLNVKQIFGGDTSEVYLLHTETERFVCKLHDGPSAFDMFQAEKEGLAAIRQTKTIATPIPFCCEELEQGAFLIMEYIEPKLPDAKAMELLGHHLAAMHNTATSTAWGWDAPNFIGPLPQSNTKCSSWATFYATERLLPQLRLAHRHHLLSSQEVPSEAKIIERCAALCSEVTPTLLHGDLWSGNFLIGKNGTPYLIDPAVYYGHAEVDLSMTRLFGGFSSGFYNAYREHIPVPEQEQELCDLYQLYYLLVHLNLFGASYRQQVLSMLKRYF